MADINNPLGKPKEQGERPLTKVVIGAGQSAMEILRTRLSFIPFGPCHHQVKLVRKSRLQECKRTDSRVAHVPSLWLTARSMTKKLSARATSPSSLRASLTRSACRRTCPSVSTPPYAHPTTDKTIQQMLTPWMEKAGANVPCQTHITRVEGTQGGPLIVYINNRDELESDVLQWAIDRRAITKKIGLEGVGVRTDEKGHVIPDDDHVSSVSNITSTGEAQGKAELTPFNTAADRHLGNRLIGLPERLPIGTNGLTEKQARKKYGNENIKIFKASFRSRYLCIVNEDPELIVLELIGAGPEERAVKTEGGAQDLRLS
ncbi:hypothetical protein EV715DRAFT_296881 [Schizophyllum commune]